MLFQANERKKNETNEKDEFYRVEARKKELEMRVIKKIVVVPFEKELETFLERK